MTNPNFITTRLAKSLKQTRETKLQQVVKDIRAIDDGLGEVVKVLAGDKTDRRKAVDNLRAMTETLHKVVEMVIEAATEAGEITKFEDQQSQIIDIATGIFQEDQEVLHRAAEIIQKAGYDLAHFETFLLAFDEYLRSDAATVNRALNLMDIPLVKQEAAKLTEERRLELIMALDSSRADL